MIGCVINFFSLADPSVLEDWLRVTRPGGSIVFSHKSKIWSEWEREHERLEREKKWRLRWVTDPPVPYLPSLKEGEGQCEEMAKVYIFEKL